MSNPIWLEVLKVIAAFAGAVAGASITLYFKEYLDRQRLRGKELQTRWLPLLRAAQDYRSKLLEFSSRYEAPREDGRWNGYTWEDPKTKEKHPLPSEARDFHELFLLDGALPPIDDFYKYPHKLNPGERRENEGAVRNVRDRIHELNGATVMLYKTAAYLGYAHRLRRELAYGRLSVPEMTKDSMLALLEDVRRALNGAEGEGFVDDLQDLLGEGMWSQADDAVIGYFEFRERILRTAGSDQFTEMFRFFVHFGQKLEYQVKDTADKLVPLCSATERVVDAYQSAWLGKHWLPRAS